jgi:hypothetical protein
MDNFADLNLTSTAFALCKRWESSTWEVRKFSDTGAMDFEMSQPIFKSKNGFLVKDQFGYYIHLDRIASGYWNNSQVIGMELLEK